MDFNYFDVKYSTEERTGNDLNSLNARSGGHQKFTEEHCHEDTNGSNSRQENIQGAACQQDTHPTIARSYALRLEAH